MFLVEIAEALTIQKLKASATRGRIDIYWTHSLYTIAANKTLVSQGAPVWHRELVWLMLKPLQDTNSCFV